MVRRPLELNASSNASVGKLRKHSCSALGTGKQQRLAAGGSRGAPVARLASAGARGRSMEKKHSNEFCPQKSRTPTLHAGFSSGEGLGPLQGVKISGHQFYRLCSIVSR